MKYFKIWLDHKFVHEHGNVFPVIPGIYKNDATVFRLCANYHDITFKEFLLITGNAEKLYMKNHTIKYENGKVVPFEDIVANLPKLKSLDYYSDGMDFTPDSANKLMEISHFKNMSHLSLYDIPETLDVAKMFDFMVANKHLKVNLCYIRQVSDQFKILLKKYSQMLKKEKNCTSTITPFSDFLDASFLLSSSSEDDEW
uniref:Uncharacterized protein n=1 Tax=Panagrolaimus davidi TaxID=227884 RepID=A0A914QYN5_9BILA